VITKVKDIPLSTEQQAVREQAEDSGSGARSAGVGSLDNSDHLKAVALRAYHGHRPSPIGNEEILQLLPMVRQIARRAASYLKPPLSFEDLVSAGTVGLLKAARDFDTSHQAEFKTYAFIRIKGAVLDELRRASLLPSGVHRQIRTALELSRKIAEQTGTPPTDEQLAEKLSITVEEVYELFEGARARHFVSLDTLDTEQPALGDLLTMAQTEAPDRLLEKAELVEELTQAMQELDERRLQIIVLYYHEHLTMKQIAEVLDITESRVSQLHASALFCLSARLEQWKDDR
jgi:RNA polymerase sigma factor for flagellar operon FliA